MSSNQIDSIRDEFFKECFPYCILSMKVFEWFKPYLHNPSLRWVKASERLPKKDGWVHIRNTGTTPGTIYYKVGDFMPSSFEWLEESGESQ